MHNWAKEMMECVKTEVETKGIDNMSRNELEELKSWAETAKEIAEFDYYYHITDAMEKSENKYGVNYDEHGRYRTKESRYDKAKKEYEESKDMNPGNENVQMIESLFRILEDDIKELKGKMTANEKAIARNKLTNFANMML